MRTWDQGDERVDKSSLSKDLVEFPVISVNGNSWKIFDKGKLISTNLRILINFNVTMIWVKFEVEKLTQICSKFVCVDKISAWIKKKKEKTGKKYRSIFHSSQKTTSCIGLKRVRCISCFYIPPNVVSTALNEYTDSRELFRFVIRFLFVVSFTFIYFTMCSNVESVPVTSIIFEQINLFDVECYITFPRPVKSS